jgi:hypothetical protein
MRCQQEPEGIIMAPHKDNKYSVNSRLIDHDAQLLEIRALIKSTLLVAGPVGAQGQTGASGADGKNGRDGRDGIDSHIAGPVGPPGRAGLAIKGDPGRQGATPRFKVGEVQTIDADQTVRVWLSGSDDLIVLNFAIPRGTAIKGDTGNTGAKGDRGDATVVNESEVASALLALRKKHAAILARIKYELELGGKQHRGMDAVLKSVYQSIQRDLENGVQ